MASGFSRKTPGRRLPDRSFPGRWRPPGDSCADQDTLKQIEGYLAKATALNARDAHAYSWLGEIRGVLGTGEPAGLVLRAISLEPDEAVHRLRAAFVLARLRRFDEAAAQARAGQTLARAAAARHDCEGEGGRRRTDLARLARHRGAW